MEIVFMTQYSIHSRFKLTFSNLLITGLNGFVMLKNYWEKPEVLRESLLG